MENKNFTVGDFVFLFYVESGIISSGRILEKTIRETISNGLNTEYVLEVYNKEGNHIETKKVKGIVFDDFFIDIGTPKNLNSAKKKPH